MPDSIPDMRSVFIVRPGEIEYAKQLENRILGVSGEAGILFVGVSVLPAGDNVPAFHCWVGCSRIVEEDTVAELIRFVLRDDIAQGITVNIEVHRGNIKAVS